MSEDEPINKPKRNAVGRIDRRAATIPEKGLASEDPKGGVSESINQNVFIRQLDAVLSVSV
jgi:hypothetical protein